MGNPAHRLRTAVARRARRRLRAEAQRGADGLRARVLAHAVLAAAPRAVVARRAERLDATVEWRVTRPDGGASVRTMSIGNGRCRVRRGVVAEPDLTLQLSVADLLALVTGSTDGARLVFGGRLRINGDLDLAMRLPKVFGRR